MLTNTKEHKKANNELVNLQFQLLFTRWAKKLLYCSKTINISYLNNKVIELLINLGLTKIQLSTWRVKMATLSGKL